MHKRIIFTFLVYLHLVNACSLACGINELTPEIKKLCNTYKWFALIENKNDKSEVKWLIKPPPEQLEKLQYILPVEIKISKKQSNRSLFCVSPNGMSTSVFHVRDGLIEIEGNKIQYALIEGHILKSDRVK